MLGATHLENQQTTVHFARYFDVAQQNNSVGERRDIAFGVGGAPKGSVAVTVNIPVIS